eukprot:3520004-Prymnesium_polylepis.1
MEASSTQHQPPAAPPVRAAPIAATSGERNPLARPGAPDVSVAETVDEFSDAVKPSRDLVDEGAGEMATEALRRFFVEEYEKERSSVEERYKRRKPDAQAATLLPYTESAAFAMKLLLRDVQEPSRASPW